MTENSNPAPDSPNAPPASTAESSAPSEGGMGSGEGADLQWVWREVRKRVFIKLPFSLGVADAMEAVQPLILDDDTFVCGMSARDYSMSSFLVADQVRNTIENILRQAAHRYIKMEIIEGTTLDDWEMIKRRRNKAQEAMIAMAEREVQEHHFEDILNQIVSEIRHRISSCRDRTLPQVRAQLLFDMVPSLADAQEMLFADPDAHDARRAMARAIDRIAGFMEVPPITLAVEVERYRREQKVPSQKT